MITQEIRIRIRMNIFTRICDDFNTHIDHPTIQKQIRSLLKLKGAIKYKNFIKLAILDKTLKESGFKLMGEKGSDYFYMDTLIPPVTFIYDSEKLQCSLLLETVARYKGFKSLSDYFISLPKMSDAFLDSINSGSVIIENK